MLPEDSEPSKGRVIVLEIVPSDKSLLLRAEREVKGGVFSIAALDSRLVLGVGSNVQVMGFSLSGESGRGYELSNETSCNGQVISLFVKSRGEGLILLGDMLCSVTLLRLSSQAETSAGSKLTEESRDFSSHNLRYVDFLDDDHFLAADDCENLFILCSGLQERSSASGGGGGAGGRMEMAMEYHLGERVNVFRRGLLNSQPRVEGVQASEPRSLLYGCVSGAVGSVSSLSEESFKFLLVMQKCLRAALSGVGGLSHEDWRCFHNERRMGSQLNAIDGDLIESFLDLSRDQMKAVVNQINFELQSANATEERDVRLASSAMETGASLPFLSVTDVIRTVENLATTH